MKIKTRKDLPNVHHHRMLADPAENHVSNYSFDWFSLFNGSISKNFQLSSVEISGAYRAIAKPMWVEPMLRISKNCR